ncbi:MAG TPA: HAMP domain-containing sensor histidine kinase [Rhizomicrobium sp.]|nr:HAMP domain-containing sensor histidine kinase [Rhizomicrobium sp.]
MSERSRARWSDAWRLVVHSLSGRLLLLTLIYVMITQVLIFLPTIGRYHRSLLDQHIESAEIAILPFTEAGGEQLSTGLRSELLMRAGASAVMLKRPEQRELFLVSEIPSKINTTIDLRNIGVVGDMVQAVDCLAEGGNRILHVVALTHIKGAQAIEVIVSEKSIYQQLVDYSGRVLLLAILISLVTALLVFLSLFLILVRPMRRITTAMVTFKDDPEDASRIIAPSQRRDEIGIAERELAVMQRDIYGFLQQKARLAALGSAVAKIQHDLRNILASAQLASDRLSKVDDPVVQRLAPRLVASIDHAVALATNTLRYGRADENPPQRRRFHLRPLIDEAAEAALAGAAPDRIITLVNEIEPTLDIDADSEQLFRIVLNILRNATQALEKQTSAPQIIVSAKRERRHVLIDIADNGPGVPPALRERLFKPFATSARPGGSGLGLAISRDLARAHGGDITLLSTGASGTVFRIDIPDRDDH